MSYKTIKTEIEDGALLLTLNRPEVRNALSMELLTELWEALKSAEDDNAVDVIILTGEGKAFSAGIDVNDFKHFKVSDDDPEYTELLKGVDAFDLLFNMKKPTIAAVNGYAITGAFELVLRCDIIIASEDASFADTHAVVGIVPGGGMTQLLSRLIGIQKAKELSFTGQFINANDALNFGLVSRVVPRDELIDTAKFLAQMIRKTNQNALHKIKEIIDRGYRLPLKEALELEKEEFTRWRKTIDVMMSEGALKKMTKEKK